MVILSEVHDIIKLEEGPVGIEDDDSVDHLVIVNSIINDHPIISHCPAGKVRSVSTKGATSSVELVLTASIDVEGAAPRSSATLIMIPLVIILVISLSKVIVPRWTSRAAIKVTMMPVESVRRTPTHVEALGRQSESLALFDADGLSK